MGVAWTDAAQALWQRIHAHRFADPALGLDFRRRLAREQAWSLADADAAIEEYRRYCLLACVAGHPVTPSDEVDQVWHLHLSYTEDYWLVFCGQVLLQSLHHGPTRGGSVEAQRYREQYAQTQASYERYFGPPPLRWWPGTQARFERPQRFVRVDCERYWLLKKPDLRRGFARLTGLLAGLGGSSAAQAQANPLDWTAEPFLLLYLLMMVILVIVNQLWRRQLRGDAEHASAHGLGTIEIAYLAGGPARVIDATVTELLESGHLTWSATEQKLRTGRTEGLGGLGGLQAQLAKAIARDGDIGKLDRTLQAPVESSRRALIQRQLWLDDAARARAAWTLSLLPGLLFCFGLAKIVIGIIRDKPVLFIGLLTLIVGIYAIVQFRNPPNRTRRGDAVLAALQHRHQRASRAPLAHELPLAVALIGTAALSGTVHGGYHLARQPPGSDGSSSGSGSDSDSGGGSGCGGCGGGGD